MHRDLKSSNVLLDPYPSSPGPGEGHREGSVHYRAKISDFGIATFKDRQVPYLPSALCRFVHSTALQSSVRAALL